MKIKLFGKFKLPGVTFYNFHIYGYFVLSKFTYFKFSNLKTCFLLLLNPIIFTVLLYPGITISCSYILRMSLNKKLRTPHCWLRIQI